MAKKNKVAKQSAATKRFVKDQMRGANKQLSKLSGIAQG